MKVLASLFRLLCSLVVLVAAALYTHTNGNPDLSAFAAQCSWETVQQLFTTVNWVSITAAVLVVAAVLRLLEIAWNMAFCASFVLVIIAASYTVFGPGIALPESIRTNTAVLDFCNLPQTYQVPALLTACVFALGWLAANAAFRIAFNTIICYLLWYGCAVLFHAAANMAAADPALAGNGTAQSILTFIQAHPWVTAALPGVFFLVYTLLMSFFDSFPPSEKKKAEEAPAAKEEKEAPAAASPAAAPLKKPSTTQPIGTKPSAAKPVLTQQTGAKPALKPQAKPTVAKPVLPPVPKVAAPKPAAEVKPEAKPEPAAEVKPEAKPEPAAEVKPEAKPEPAAEVKPEAKPEPAAEVKPEAKPAEEAPAAEQKA